MFIIFILVLVTINMVSLHELQRFCRYYLWSLLSGWLNLRSYQWSPLSVYQSGLFVLGALQRGCPFVPFLLPMFRGPLWRKIVAFAIGICLENHVVNFPLCYIPHFMLILWFSRIGYISQCTATDIQKCFDCSHTSWYHQVCNNLFYVSNAYLWCVCFPRWA